MTSFLEKLDRKAKRLLDTMDSQLQQPTMQILSGDVFTHDTDTVSPVTPKLKIQPAVEYPPLPEAAPARDPVGTDYVRKPLLRQAGATNGS